MTEDIGGSQNGESGKEAKSEKAGAGVGICDEDDWVSSVVVIIVCCPFEANTVEGAVSIFLQRNDFDKLNKSDPVGDIL